jgi:L-lactate permease
MKHEEESLLFRFTLKHSMLLALIIGLTVMVLAYVLPGWAA